MTLSAAGVAKYRLGAPDSIIVDANTASPLALGMTSGGLSVVYKATIVKGVVDQTPAEVQAWRSAEALSVEVTLPQTQMNLLTAAMSQSVTGVTTTAAGTLATAGPPTLATFGTAGVTSYSYEVFFFNDNGDGVPSTAATIATGPTTLSTSAGVNVTLPSATAGATGIGIIRTAGGLSQGLVDRVDISMAGQVVQDNGLVASAYTASATAPATPNIDTTNIGGQIFLPKHQLNVAIPKNDGTANHLRYLFWNCVFQGDVTVNHDRTKATEYKVTLDVLANLSQPVGAQLCQITEEY